MANTSSRTLRLLSLLQARRYWPGQTLAERLDVSVRTLRRDIDRLRELGYPVEASRGVDGGYQLAAGAALPPLVIDDEEAVALAVAIQSRVTAPATGDLDSGEGGADAALRALTKIIQVMPARLRRRVDAVRSVTTPAFWNARPAPPIDHEVLTGLAQGCRDQERVRFAYTRADATAGRRHVEPYRLVPLSRRWYLVAYDLDRQDWRSFRLDRISEVTGTAARFGPRTAPFDDPAAFVREGVTRASAAQLQRAELIIDAPLAVVEERIGRWVRATAIDAEHTQVVMEIDDLSWALFAAGTVEAPFTIIGPAALRDQAAAWGRRFLTAAES